MGSTSFQHPASWVSRWLPAAPRSMAILYYGLGCVRRYDDRKFFSLMERHRKEGDVKGTEDGSMVL